MQEQIRSRFSISITNNSVLEQLENIAGCLGKSKSYIINQVLDQYLTAYINNMMYDTPKNIKKPEWAKTQVVVENDAQLKVDVLVTQQMVASIYQHFILFLGMLQEQGYPGISISLKERFDTTLPPNFEGLKDFLLKQLNFKKEGDE
ncbi:MAG: hypothetical protein IJS58_10065 [Bacilli bacterium]|nr:hypothetical protein [Bacilli bacterium]